MKKQIQKWCMALCCIAAPLFHSCSDNNEFPNQPKAIDVNDLVITPVSGGLDVAWTPDPADKNFVYLHVNFIDQDNKERSYNISRYGSSLVNPPTNNEGGFPNEADEAVVVKIRGLVNQEYTLNFYAYNEENNAISLGSRKSTPGDYTQCPPDSIYAVNIQAKGGKIVGLDWQELPIHSGSTIDKIFFNFTNQKTGATTPVEFATKLRHAEVALEDAGYYSVEYGTRSLIGKEWKKKASDINVIKFKSIERWTAAEKKGWVVTGTSVQESEGPYNYLIDGNKNTYWAANWGAGSLPHKLYIALDKEEEIVGVIMQQRQNCSKPSWHRCVKDFTLFFKEKDADEYPTTANYKGQFEINQDPSGQDHLAAQYFYFESVYKAKYICISIDSSMFDTGGQVCMAEFGIIIKSGSDD